VTGDHPLPLPRVPPSGLRPSWGKRRTLAPVHGPGAAGRLVAAGGDHLLAGRVAPGPRRAGERLGAEELLGGRRVAGRTLLILLFCTLFGSEKRILRRDLRSNRRANAKGPAGRRSTSAPAERAELAGGEQLPARPSSSSPSRVSYLPLLRRVGKGGDLGVGVGWGGLRNRSRFDLRNGATLALPCLYTPLRTYTIPLSTVDQREVAR